MIHLALTMFMLTAPAMQNQSMQDQSMQDQSQYKVTLDFHAVHQFGTAIDGGGRARVTRGGLELRLDSNLTENDDLQFRFQYQRDDWDFSGAGFGGALPWRSIDTVDFSVQWTHQFSDTTSWFAAGNFRSSYEDTYSDGFVSGGALGVIHSFSNDLTLGIGAGVIEQEKGNTRVYPVFVLEWSISETLRLTSDISSRFGSRTGVELVWSPRNDWSFGIGVAYDYSRFRLDSRGIAPNGAGEATSIPLTLRATSHVSPAFDLTVYGGIVFAGQLDVVNVASQTVSSSGYDPAGMIGVLGQLRF